MSSCYHPLKAFSIGLYPSGKTRYKITSFDCDHVEYYKARDSWSAVASPYRSSLADKVVSDYIEIPCGQCIGCRLQYSRQWANRLMLEASTQQNFYFLTLTYDETNVPLSYYCNNVTGEVESSLTLRKRDLQLFFKKLRNHFPDSRIRYYAAGEYGENTFRPHYHIILYGVEFSDLLLVECSHSGEPQFESNLLSKLWPFGRHRISNASWETCAYTARYVVKKLKGTQAEFYETFNIQPEFALMSRKPGIGRDYYDNHPDIYKYDFITLSSERRGLKFKPPRYYDKLYDIDHSDDSSAMKEKRKFFAEQAIKAKLQRTSLSYLEYLAVEEHKQLDSIKSCERRLE